MKWWWPTRDT